MKKIKIGYLVGILYVFNGFTVSSQNSQSNENVPCEKCVVFTGLKEKPKLNKYDNKTYYQYMYVNQCSEPVDMWWDCNGEKKRTLPPGIPQRIEGPCGDGNGVQVIKIKCKT